MPSNYGPFVIALGHGPAIYFDLIDEHPGVDSTGTFGVEY